MADILFWDNILAQNNIVRLKNKAYNAIIIKKYFYRQISTKFDISLCFNIFHIFYMWKGGNYEGLCY